MGPPVSHFELQMPLPLGDPWACFGGLGADVRVPGGLFSALGEHFGALGVGSGFPGSAPGTVFGTIFGPF